MLTESLSARYYFSFHYVSNSVLNKHSQLLKLVKKPCLSFRYKDQNMSKIATIKENIFLDSSLEDIYEVPQNL